MINFARINNYYNKQEAWKDWLHLAKQAHMANQTALVRKFQPADNAGWKTIDKKLGLLREALTESNIAWSRLVSTLRKQALNNPPSYFSDAGS